MNKRAVFVDTFSSSQYKLLFFLFFPINLSFCIIKLVDRKAKLHSHLAGGHPMNQLRANSEHLLMRWSIIY